MKKFLLIALLCVSGNVGADFFNANKLLSDCTETGLYCLGYIASASNTHETWVGWGVMSKQICMPEGVSGGQLRRVVVKYLEANPAELHTNASGMVLNALRLAFPCTE